MALIDVIIPTYNFGPFIVETLKSVLMQSFTDFNVLVIDNNSTDNTEDLVCDLMENEPRIRYVKNPINIGSAQSIKKAILMTHSEYFMILCADDILEPSYFEKVLVHGLEKNPECSMGYSLTSTLIDGIKIDAMRMHYPPLETGVHDVLEFFCFTNWVLLSFGIIRRSVYEKHKLIDSFHQKFYPGTPREGNLGDHYLWIKLTSENPAYVVNERLGIYRVHQESHTRLTTSQSLLEETIILYDLIFYDRDFFNDKVRYMAKINQMGRLLTDIGVCNAALYLIGSRKCGPVFESDPIPILMGVCSAMRKLVYDSDSKVKNPLLDKIQNIEKLEYFIEETKLKQAHQ